eukprot:scaffold75514_cov83-Phaeocystis_antarctica.AAC.3
MMHIASWMRLRREWLGLSCLLSSSAPVAGDVLWVSSHSSMALRSYVWPSTCFAMWGGQTAEDGLGVGWCGLELRVRDMQKRPLGQ